ncbi:hypothetical protein AVEN_188222-1, partial [Araneus ventricosus]
PPTAAPPSLAAATGRGEVTGGDTSDWRNSSRGRGKEEN